MHVKVPRGPKGQIRRVTIITKRAKPLDGQRIGSPLERKTFDDIPQELPKACLKDQVVNRFGATGRLVECDPPTKADLNLRLEREAKLAAARGRRHVDPELQDLANDLGDEGKGDGKGDDAGAGAGG